MTNRALRLSAEPLTDSELRERLSEVLSTHDAPMAEALAIDFSEGKPFRGAVTVVTTAYDDWAGDCENALRDARRGDLLSEFLIGRDHAGAGDAMREVYGRQRALIDEWSAELPAST